MPTLLEKTCRRCGKKKGGDDFRPNAKLRDGLDSWCRDCHREAARVSKAKYRERYNAARRKAPEQHQCVVCGQSFASARSVRRYCSQRCAKVAERQLERDRDHQRAEADPEYLERRRLKRRKHHARLRER